MLCHTVSVNSGRIAGAALVVLLLGGCSAAVPSSTPRPTETATIEPTPVQSETPPSRPDESDLVLTSEGLGYLKIGDPVPEMESAVAIVELDPDYPCYPPTGAWLTTYHDDAFVIRTENAVPSAAVDWILVKSTDIGTDRGIHVGDTREVVLAAYPEASESAQSGGDIDLYIATGDRGMLLFEFATSAGEYPVDQLLWIRALDVDYPFVYPIANTGAGGPCES